MKPLLCINDIHIGAVRTGGTTPATAAKLRANLLADYAGLLDMAGTDDVLINGDWLDTASIPFSDLFQTYLTTAQWLALPHAPKLYAARGNHDMTKNSAVLSSFDLLCGLLAERFPEQVTVTTELTKIDESVYVLPHMANQDLFELELSKVPACYVLFLHCNVSNNFAAKSDHSLNLSLEQAQTLKVDQIIVAHEHQHRRYLDGKIEIVGNQVPSSVADCLGNDTKFAVRLTDEHGLQWLPTWESKDSYIEMDWESLDLGSTHDFVRIIGKATAAQAGDVVAAISGLRKSSPALVITNAVEIEGTNDGASMQVSLEQIKSFSVLEELLKILNDKERLVVTGLLEKNTL